LDGVAYRVENEHVAFPLNRIVMSFSLFRQISSVHPTKPELFAASPWFFPQDGYNC
jgi:hypothetical protein